MKPKVGRNFTSERGGGQGRSEIFETVPKSSVKPTVGCKAYSIESRPRSRHTFKNRSLNKI